MGYLAQNLLLSWLLYSGGFMGGLEEAGAPPPPKLSRPHPTWMIPIINLKRGYTHIQLRFFVVVVIVVVLINRKLA